MYGSAAHALLGLGDLTVNNPGNIEKTTGINKWRGEYTCDRPRFACFETIGYGYRAMFVLLRNYINMGFNTIETMLNRWAPPHENDTAAYVKFVSQKSGIGANTPIHPDDIDSLERIVSAMSHMENGVPAVAAQVSEGKELARDRFGEYVKAGAGALGALGLGLAAWTIYKLVKR